MVLDSLVSIVKNIGDNSSDGCVLIDSEYKIVWINETLEKKGFTLESIKGTLYYHTFNNQNELDPNCSTAKAFQTGQIEKKIEKGSDKKEYEIISIPITANNKVEFVVEIGKESSSQEKIQPNQPKHPGTWVEEGVKNTFDSIFVTDKEYRITYVNKSFEKLSNSKKDDILGEIPTIFKSRKTDPGIYKEFWKTINAGNVWEHKLRGKRKDNSTYPSEIKIIPVRDELGFIKNYIGIEKDTSQEKKIQERLERFKLFPDLKPDPVLQTNYEGVIEEFCGKDTIKQFGDIKEKHISTILENVTVKLNEIKGTGEQKLLDCGVKIPGKKYQIVAVDIPKKRLINFYFSDITHIKKIEKKLRTRNEELEQFYRLAIGRELKMIELKKKIKMLEEMLGKKQVEG